MPCNFLVRMLKYFLKNKHFLPTKSWKNHHQKLLRKPQIHFFSLLPWAAQMAQREEFCFQKMAYRITVYSSGLKRILCIYLKLTLCDLLLDSYYTYSFYYTYCSNFWWVLLFIFCTALLFLLCIGIVLKCGW